MQQSVFNEILGIAITNIENQVAAAPDFHDDDWDESFAMRAAYFRELIADLVGIDDAVYRGMVGDHCLSLGPIETYSDDGYRLLLLDWCHTATAAVAEGRFHAA